MPVIPTNPLSEEEISPVMTKPRALSEDNWVDPDIYVNVKVSKYFLNYYILFIILFCTKYSLVKNLQKHWVLLQYHLN